MFLWMFCIVLKIGGRIKSSVQQLGTSCISLVQVAGQLQCNPSDNFAKADLTSHAKKVFENVRKSVLEHINAIVKTSHK